MPGKKLYANTALLSGATLLMTGIGLLFQAWLVRRIGAAGLADARTLYLLLTSLVTLLIAAAASTPLVRALYYRTAEKCRPLALALMAVTLVLCLAYLVYQSYNPFLYFRF